MRRFRFFSCETNEVQVTAVSIKIYCCICIACGCFRVSDCALAEETNSMGDFESLPHQAASNGNTRNYCSEGAEDDPEAMVAESGTGFRYYDH